MSTWNGQDSLFGHWHVDLEFEMNLDPLGFDGSMIEAVVGTTTPMDPKHVISNNGFNVFSYVEREGSRCLKFVGVRDDFPNGESHKWWEELPVGEDDESEDRDGNDYLGVVVRRVSKRAPLFLAETDFLPKEDPDKNIRIYTKGGFSNETPLHEANAMLDHYHDGSNSWMCTHVPGMTPRIASCIRAFVTPPPVFFLQQGDLIVEMEESREPEWSKFMILRRANAKASPP